MIGVPSFRTGRGRPFLQRMADLDPLLETIRREAPNVGVLIDLFHLHAAGESIESAFGLGNGSLVRVHVAELPASAAGERD